MPSNFSKFALALCVLCATPAVAAEKPTMLSRNAWQAKPPSLAMTKQKPVAILLHHTGSPMKIKTTLATQMRGLQRFSQAQEKLADGRTKPAWPDVPYHFYIAANGNIAEGRDINAVGDTNTGYDPKGFIQVVVEGNFEIETPKPSQLASLRLLLEWLKQSYDINNSAITAHKQEAQTACPGKNLSAVLGELVKGLK
jgi:N-acetylmuramoyl-L-alanine amidase